MAGCSPSGSPRSIRGERFQFHDGGAEPAASAGTDQFGRDISPSGVRGAYGDDRRLRPAVARTDRPGAGVTSAYFGGWFDLVLQRIFDILMAFPLIILALAVVSCSAPVSSMSSSPSHSARSPLWRVVRRARLPCASALRRRRPCAGFSMPASCCAICAQRAGVVPDPALGLRRPSHPREGRSPTLASRAGACGVGLMLQGSARLCHDGTVDRDLSGSHRPDGAGRQPVRRRAARCHRSQARDARRFRRILHARRGLL